MCCSFNFSPWEDQLTHTDLMTAHLINWGCDHSHYRSRTKMPLTFHFKCSVSDTITQEWTAAIKFHKQSFEIKSCHRSRLRQHFNVASKALQCWELQNSPPVRKKRSPGLGHTQLEWPGVPLGVIYLFLLEVTDVVLGDCETRHLLASASKNVSVPVLAAWQWTDSPQWGTAEQQ